MNDLNKHDKRLSGAPDPLPLGTTNHSIREAAEFAADQWEKSGLRAVIQEEKKDDQPGFSVKIFRRAEDK